MNIYVASGFMNYRTARWWVDAFRAEGHEVRYDWTDTDEFDESGTLRYSANINGDPQHALNDYRGVLECDVLVLLCTDAMHGAVWEAGMALGAGKTVVCVNPLRPSIFHHLDSVHVVKGEGSEVFDETLRVIGTLEGDDYSSDPGTLADLQRPGFVHDHARHDIPGNWFPEDLRS